jgi:uncharacterized protein YegL
MKSNFIHVCFVIDESSSMYDSVSDVVAGFKKIIDEQKANSEGTCAISIFRFASDVKDPDFIGKDIKEISNELEYHPYGCTAMYDGIGIAIDTIGKWLNNIPEEERPEKNLIVIMTDGEENNSKEYSASRVREMIKHQEEKYSWTFLYIGTDITNTKDADNLGFSSRFATTRSKLGKSYDAINSVVNCYRVTAGDYDTKNLAMEASLNSTVTTLNAEYLSDTGVHINTKNDD